MKGTYLNTTFLECKIGFILEVTAAPCMNYVIHLETRLTAAPLFLTPCKDVSYFQLGVLFM